MNEFIEKLIGRLKEMAKLYEREEEIQKKSNPCYQIGVYGFESLGFKKSIEIANQLAEEYKDKDCSKCSRRSWYQKGYADAEKNNGWIYCEEKLPEAKDCLENMCAYFLTTEKYQSTTQRRYFNLSTGKWYSGSDGTIEITDVLAWKPLPKRCDKK